MDLCIAFEGDITEEKSYQTDCLAKLIKHECCLELKIERSEIQEGVKDDGLAIGIAIASLGVAAIQSLVAVLQYWESKNPKYSLSIRMRNETFLIENLSKEEFKRKLRKIQTGIPTESIKVVISEKYR
jgi:hypothetical protein